MTVKAYTREMIIKWHVNGYATDEILPLIPFCTRQEVDAIISEYEKEQQ